MSNRVVVTGMGAVSPLGNSSSTFLKGIMNSKVGISPITHFDSTNTGITLGAEVKNFDPLKKIPKKIARKMDRYAQYGLYSAIEAMKNAGLDKDNYKGEDLGVIYGSGIGGVDTIENQVIKMYKKGPKRVSPLFIPKVIGNMAAGNISMYFNARNTSQGIVTACSTGTNAIGNAFEYVKSGKAKSMIAGGSEAAINETGIAGFAALTALSQSRDSQHASMPFDKNRSGFVMGEGAGTLILENYDYAKKRGAKILAEVVGYGSTSDAAHLTSPDPEGKGAFEAMRQALDEGGIKANSLDYINAHGTSTQANDVSESKAISKLFKNNNHLKVSSIKGMTGHGLGAAGALEAIAVVGALEQNKMPVNVGVTNQDIECKINLVSERDGKTKLKTAISNSFGFGGHNAVLAFRKWEM